MSSEAQSQPNSREAFLGRLASRLRMRKWAVRIAAVSLPGLTAAILLALFVEKVRDSADRLT